jgi:hypothetical protein
MSGNGGDIIIKAGSGGYEAKPPDIRERLRDVLKEALSDGLEPENLENLVKEAVVKQIMED